MWIPRKLPFTNNCQAINAGTAFGLALYPVFIVWDLQMSKRLKFGICILLGIGVFMGICAILKAVQLKAIGSTNDPTCEW